MVSARPDYQRQVMQALIGDYPLLAFGRAVQRVHAQMKQFLRAQGTPIPENDVWIAAFALAYRLPLLTRDRHFEALRGLAGVEVMFLPEETPRCDQS
ncbi:MAG: hypothetical protein NZ550_04435 [Fimbriimonadales bacterium]|nr:hypothetical protein [Fimbriimonadales bacterium]